MKKILFLFPVLLTLFFSACSSDSEDSSSDDPTPSPDNGAVVEGCTDPNSSTYNPDATVEDGTCEYPLESAVSANPQTYTTKVVVEQMTGTWCGWCVDGSYRLSNLIEQYDGRVIGAAVHQGDEMENASIFNFFNGRFGVSGFPSGLVNRVAARSSGDFVMGRGEWGENVDALINNTQNLGLAIEAENVDGQLNVLVHVGNSEAIGDNYRLVVFLTQDNVQSAQNNYYSSAYGTGGQGHPYYDRPAVINSYRHQHVVREVLTSLTGVPLPDFAKEAGATFTRFYSVDVSEGYGFAPEFNIVAMVVEGGATAATSKIINVQKVSVPREGVGVQDFD